MQLGLSDALFSYSREVMFSVGKGDVAVFHLAKRHEAYRAMYYRIKTSQGVMAIIAK